ncbi:MAG: hypothetical protein ACR650_07275 [Methylocystis sp.]
MRRNGLRKSLSRYGNSYEEARYGDSVEDCHHDTTEEVDGRLKKLLTPAEFAAVDLLYAKNESPKAPYLSEALELYLRQHPKGSNKRFSGNNRLAISNVIDAVGDLRLTEYTRRHASKVRDQMLAKGLKTASVRRRFDHVAPIFNAAVDEYGLAASNGVSLPNPFAGIRIVDLRSAKSSPRRSLGNSLMRPPCAM